MNIIDYVETNMDSFETLPFNQVDSLVLSQFIYINFAGFVPGLEEDREPIKISELLMAEHIPKMLDKVWAPDENYKLLLALGMSPRFRDIFMWNYSESIDITEEKQFTALTYLIDENNAYIAYRGTDLSLVGWKEDFNMAFLSPIPSQIEGTSYLDRVANKIPHKLILGGHSKGGNIAVYSAMECQPPIQSRIRNVFTHDGPGFKDEILTSEKYIRVKSKIKKTLPQFSLIGMLLHHQEDYLVVESKQFRIMQHDPFSWIVENKDFKYAEGITSGAEHINLVINKWLTTLDDEKLELFISTLYNIIESTGVTDFNDLSEDWFKKATLALGAIKETDEETKDFVSKTLKSFLSLYIKNLSIFHKNNKD